jgi:tetratricopeptide (TPR) repeat protein
MPGTPGPSSAWAQLRDGAAILAAFAGDWTEARGWMEQVVAYWRRRDDRLGLAVALFGVGCTAREQADFVAAAKWLEESVGLAQELGDAIGVGRVLDALGTVAHGIGDYALAGSRFEASLSLARQTEDRHEQAWSLHNMGLLAFDQGDYRTARAKLAEALALREEHDTVGFVHALAAFASLATAEKRPECALRLAGARTALTQRTGILVQPSEGNRYERWLAIARQGLDAEAAALAWADGRAMSLDQAVIYALEQNIDLR